MKNLLIFLLGLLTGLVVSFFAIYFFFFREVNQYVETKSDYNLENGSVIRRGTVLKIDQTFSEGFTRYILYLNLTDGERVERHDEPIHDIVIPYWMSPDTIPTQGAY